MLDAISRQNSSVTLVGENPKPSVADIRAGLTRGDTIYIAHIPALVHFVLLTNFTDSEPDWFTVNDAFYNATRYQYTNISDILIYSIKPSGGDDGSEAESRPPTSSSGLAVASSSGGIVHLRPRVAPELVAREGVVTGSAPVIPFAYPLFKQCNASWGAHKMVNATICEVGCLMSSVAMALRFNKVSVDGTASDPDSLNTWLRGNE